MKYINLIIVTLIVLVAASCSKDEIELTLMNDFLKKTEAPPVAGEKLEFAYAMATREGFLKTATAEVTFAGASGTGFETKSYHVDSKGTDIGVLVADTSTVSTLSSATFKKDTVAATLRFTYVVPKEAKGKIINITFKVESTLGKVTTIKSPDYKVSNIDIARNIIMTNKNACYFSLETMKSYTEAEVNTQNMQDKIDLIYGYDATTPAPEKYAYGHALLSPSTEAKYLNGRTVPVNFKLNKSKIEKKVFLNDMLLSGALPATYVDDIDLQTLDISHALDFILGIVAKNSVLIESEDGKYRAYIYISAAASSKLTFSVKRLTMK